LPHLLLIRKFPFCRNFSLAKKKEKNCDFLKEKKKSRRE
jgi:hypothetical protein